MGDVFFSQTFSLPLRGRGGVGVMCSGSHDSALSHPPPTPSLREGNILEGRDVVVMEVDHG